MTKGLFTRAPQIMAARFADFLKECYIDKGVLELCEAQTDDKVKVWGYFLPAINKIVWNTSWTIDKSEEASLDESSDEDIKP